MAFPGIAYDKLPPIAKNVIFYGAFGALYLIYALIVVTPLAGAREISTATMENIASYAPIVLQELSIPGELVPAVLGGLMAWTAPSRTANAQVVFLLVLSAIAWIMYLHMQVMFSDPVILDILTSSNTTPADAPKSVATLSAFASNVRSFAAVVFAAILGLRFNDANPVLNPVPAPAPTPAPAVPTTVAPVLPTTAAPAAVTTTPAPVVMPAPTTQPPGGGASP